MFPTILKLSEQNKLYFFSVVQLILSTLHIQCPLFQTFRRTERVFIGCSNVQVPYKVMGKTENQGSYARALLPGL